MQRLRLIFLCGLLLAPAALDAGADHPARRSPQPARAPAAAPEHPDVAHGGRPTRADQYGDPLPPGALARMGTVRWRDGGGIDAIIASPDGKVIITAAESIRLWDQATGKELRRLPQVADSLALSADGTTLAAGGRGTVRVWDLATGKELGRPVVAQALVTLSRDGKTLITAGSPPLLSTATPGLDFWDVATGIHSVHLPLAAPLNAIDRVAAAPDNGTLAVSDPEGTIQLLEVASGKPIRQLPGHHGRITALAFSADGKLLASGEYGAESGIPRGPVRLWEVATGRELYRLEGATGRTESLAFSPDGQLLAGTRGGAVHVWETATGKARNGPPTGRYFFAAVAFSRDGKALITGGLAQPIGLWDAAAGKRLNPDPSPQGSITSVTFFPDSRVLATAGFDGTIRLWEATTGRELSRWTAGPEPPWLLAFPPDGKFLASGGARGEKVVRLWGPATGQEVHALGGHGNRVQAFAFSADG